MIQETGDIFHLRKAEPSDASFVLWLEEACMKDHAVAIWGQWRASGTTHSLDLSNHEIIVFHGKPVGCLATRHDRNTLFLSRLFIAPDFQRQGIGETCLKTVIDRAGHDGLPIRLEVLSTNPAIEFYKKHGFITLRTTPERSVMIRRHTRPQKD